MLALKTNIVVLTHKHKITLHCVLSCIDLSSQYAVDSELSEEARTLKSKFKQEGIITVTKLRDKHFKFSAKSGIGLKLRGSRSCQLNFLPGGSNY